MPHSPPPSGAPPHRNPPAEGSRQPPGRRWGMGSQSVLAHLLSDAKGKPQSDSAPAGKN